MLSINLTAVIVAALAAFVIGFLFHGPLFGKLWMKLANIQMTGKEKLSDMLPQMAWNLLSNLVTAGVLAIIYSLTASSSYISGFGKCGGVVLAIWLWLGFLVTSSSIEVIWMGRNVKLWLFECVSSLVVMISMGAIIGNW